MKSKVKNYIQKYKNIIVNLFISGKTYAELKKANIEYKKALYIFATIHNKYFQFIHKKKITVT